MNPISDPLSDPKKCIRDISLFQELGINTIRVYSINPELNHDKCMTLLATAGIYLVLDVNSPLEGQHLNRYEPWTTYNEIYIKHVFDVIHEFSGYNNTLGFFAGNEIVNDETSANHAPVYVKAIVRDMKQFLKQISPRPIPVGYSAADDLAYRISLAEYLECYDSEPVETIDFYGVNTYQWCGEQTFLTSGYNHLVRDYSGYSKPIFFSEYGCNEVLPRTFKEVESIFSNQMTDVFSGGLLYEYSQQPNNYGLVDYDEDGNVILLPDFSMFKKQITKIKDVVLSEELPLHNPEIINGKSTKEVNSLTSKKCKTQYDNLDISKGTPKSLVSISATKRLTNKEKGKYITLSKEDFTCDHKVFTLDNVIIHDSLTVVPIAEYISDLGNSVSCK